MANTLSELFLLKGELITTDPLGTVKPATGRYHKVHAMNGFNR